MTCKVARYILNDDEVALKSGPVLGERYLTYVQYLKQLSLYTFHFGHMK